MPLVRTAVPEVGLAITISQCRTGNTRGGVSWLQPFIRRTQRPIFPPHSFRTFKTAGMEATFVS